MLSIILLSLLFHHVIFTTPSTVTLTNNEYRGVVIAINPEIPENSSLIEAIKSVWTDASQALYKATKQRAYFGQITILIPKTWTSGTYQPPETETYVDADVLVANPNPVYQDQPYTLQYGRCGEPASYIHLTPSYLINDNFIEDFGPKGKAVVHEWGHYRWGVFDETPTYGFDPFYYDNIGRIQATKCPLYLRGEFKVIDYSNGTTRDCERTVQNGLPEDDCVFVPYEEQSSDLSASIMSHQYLKEVETFCNNNESDSYNKHNKYAPNEQNRMCDLKSTWEVIVESDDFANHNYPNTEFLDTTPIFNIMRAQTSQRYVLVLDTSGSMDGTRLAQMRQVVNIFIQQFVPIGDRVAIVEFANTAKELAGLTPVQNQFDKDYLLDRFPTDASGNTCIGCGLQEAIKTLEENGGDAAGGNIITFTDGEENLDPRVKDVAVEIMQKGAIVHAIFFATDSNNDLEELAENTTGIWFFGSDQNIISILGAFESLASADNGDVYSEVFQVHSSTFAVDQCSTYTGDVDIDATVGNSTVFTFTWDRYNVALPVVLEHPSGCTYSTNSITVKPCSGHPLSITDHDFKVISFPLPGTVDPGRWKYYVTSRSSQNQTVVTTVTSKASNRSKQPIVVNSGLDKSEAGTGDAIVVYAQVSQGFAPILDALVVAKIERPDGSVQMLDLYDAGAAPDTRKDDGVYSRFFTGYNDPGSYAVQVTVTKTDNISSINRNTIPTSRANLKVGTIRADGSIVINPNAGKYMTNNLIPSDVGSFSRVVTNKGFKYSGVPVNAANDYFPPSKITNLVAQQLDVYTPDSGIILTFTAPGGNFDKGQATRYEIRYVIDNLTQLVDAFETGQVINGSNLINGTLNQPQVAGSTETFLMGPLIVSSKDQITLGFAVRAYDEQRNVADPSNIAPVVYFYSPPPGAADHPPGTADIPDPTKVIVLASTLIFIFIIIFIIILLFSLKCCKLSHFTSKINKDIELQEESRNYRKI